MHHLTQVSKMRKSHRKRCLPQEPKPQLDYMIRIRDSILGISKIDKLHSWFGLGDSEFTNPIRISHLVLQTGAPGTLRALDAQGAYGVLGAPNSPKSVIGFKKKKRVV